MFPRFEITREIAIYSIINLIGLAVALFYIIQGSVEIWTPSCDYKTFLWKFSFGIFGLTMAALGLANIFTSWKYRIFTKIYTALIVLGFSMLLGFFILFEMFTFNMDSNFSFVARRFVTGENWDKVVACYEEQDVCKAVRENSDLMLQPNTMIEGYCCRPPYRCMESIKNESYWERLEDNNECNGYCCGAPGTCGFQLKNGTKLEVLKDDDECNVWIRKGGRECFDCRQCKYGYVHKMRLEGILQILYAIIVFVGYTVARSCEGEIRRTIRVRA